MATIDGLLFALTLFAALGCGLMAGFFFAFSASVIKVLARLPSAEGIAAMQSINVAILNPVFLAAFLGTTAGGERLGRVRLLTLPNRRIHDPYVRL